MSRDSDPIIQKDGRRLSKINLSKDEQIAIKQLIKVLAPFASGIELLEESKYAKISFMYDVITKIKKGVYSTYDIESEDIDLTNHITVFDDDMGIEDPNDDNEINDHPKR